MNKVELEIAEKIAKIEGEWFTVSRDGVPHVLLEFAESPKHPLPTHYNPFNWSVLGPLMVKYEVAIDYINESVDIFEETTGNYLCWELFEDESEIPAAILKCIIKSKEA